MKKSLEKPLADEIKDRAGAVHEGSEIVIKHHKEREKLNGRLICEPRFYKMVWHQRQ